ncbi:MAG: chemotaxis-specific protein-glutamate methyltransferase CheB [Spirochaetia bacterium]|nr:chemotaxis-specific protein-glutamate methyltransferase CheB [Spirochaetia bacterium]
MIKTLIVDDSPVIRSILRDFLESDGSFEIVGEAENGKEGVEKARALNPDLITMDIEMPVMGGLEAIAEIKQSMNTPIVVISTHDTAKMAYEATVKGAMEFYSKDHFTSSMTPQNQQNILETLKHISSVRRPTLTKQQIQTPIRSAGNNKINAVVIASSTGGPKALSSLCAALPADFPVPIILVQHNSSGFDKGFVQWLDTYTPLEVRLAKAGEKPVKGKFYVAPTDKHLLIEHGVFVFDNGEPVNNQKPAADVLFKSAAGFYGSAVISAVLTGMGADGANGSYYIKQSGGITIAQDEATSMIYGMPQAAANTGCIDMVLPLDKIPARLIILTKS